MSKNKRNTKWYRKNEKEVAEMFGMKPTKNSGAGWVEKEDFQNDYILCQLKSTDAQSISIKKKDIDILEYNATVSHKVPLFMIQFIETNDCFVLCRPDDVQLLSEYLKTKKIEKKENFVLTNEIEDSIIKSNKRIESNPEAREKYYETMAESKKERKRKNVRKERIEAQSGDKNQIFWC